MINDGDLTTEAGVVANLAVKAASPHLFRELAVPFVVRDADQMVHALTDLLENPLEDPGRIRAAAEFLTVESFVDYVKAFQVKGRTKLFASAQGAEVTAYLDYHGPNTPSRVTHSARLKLKLSREWQTWFSNNKKQIPQATFAEFLEDNVLDIIQPDSATIIEAAKHLEAKKNVAFTSGINLRDGSIQFKYEEEIESRGKGDLEVPDGFIIRVSPFDRGTAVSVPVRLRFRITDQKLFFIYVMQQPENILETAFEGVIEEITEALGVKPLFGSVTFK